MLLTTERLLLREFTENDWHAVFACQADPRYLRYSPWTHRLREDMERLVQEFIGWLDRFPVPVGIKIAAAERGLKVGPYAAPFSPETKRAAGEFPTHHGRGVAN